MISRNCLAKLGDYRENKIADKQKNDASFMVAWTELKEIIEFVEKSERKDSQKIGHKRLDSQTTAVTAASREDKNISDSGKPMKLRNCRVEIQRLTDNQLKLIESVSADIDDLSKPVHKLKKCHVVLKRMPEEAQNLTEKPTSLPNKKPEKAKQKVDVVTCAGPLTENLNVKKILKPAKMMTRSGNNKIELKRKRRNEENE